ncbi:Rpn family recombination-promoting nuclease/putative transposase, partial [Brenneria sp. L3-3Z]
TVTPDEEIKTHRRAALLELVLKHIRTRDMLELARDIGMLMEMWTLPLTQQRALMFYIAHMGRTSDVPSFIATLKTYPGGEQMATIAQELMQQGKEKWLAEGLEQGIEQGVEQGMRASALRIARQMLKNGMPPQQVQQMTDLSDDDMQAVMLVTDE